MTGSELAAKFALLCVALVGYGVLKRFTQVVLFVLNHWRRSE